MHLRDRYALVNMVTVVVACLTMLVYTFSSPGNHAANLHGTLPAVVADNHSSAHGHDHGDHSHDDLDVALDDIGASDHHHADHTHEKAGLVQASGQVLRHARPTDYVTLASSLVGGPPHGIDRPPRTVTLV